MTARSPAESPPADSSRDVYQLKASTIGCAGTSSLGGGVMLRGTLSQFSLIGTAWSDLVEHQAGFWPIVGLAGVPVGVPDVPPAETRLLPNAPNPFNPITTVRFEVARASRVAVVVYDLRGRQVRRLVNEAVEAGRFSVAWDGRDDHGRGVPSGPYFCRMQADGFSAVQKMLLVK